MTLRTILFLMIGIVFIMLLYWFKLRALKRRLALAILGLIITVLPTLSFFSVLHFWMEFFFERRGGVQWRVSLNQNLIALIGGWTGRYATLSNLIISIILTPVFFICLALLIKEWINRRNKHPTPLPPMKTTGSIS